MIKCKHCGQELPDGSRFCSICGKAVEQNERMPLKCPHCGLGNLPAQARFCPSCGTKLEKEAEKAQPPKLEPPKPEQKKTEPQKPEPQKPVPPKPQPPKPEPAINTFNMGTEYTEIQGMDNKQIALLGMDYLYGKNGKMLNLALAHRYLLLAAGRGEPTAMYGIGHMYYYGKDIKQDYTLAAQWFGKSANGGSPDGMYWLAECYRQRQGVEKNGREAFKWFEKAANMGHVEAQYRLAQFYYQGESVVANEEKARYWYKKAADQGHIESKRQFFVLSLPKLGPSQKGGLCIGDFYYSDGTISHKRKEGVAPVGVVFSLETTEEEKRHGWTHGQIVALSHIAVQAERSSWLKTTHNMEIKLHWHRKKNGKMHEQLFKTPCSDLLAALNDIDGFLHTIDKRTVDASYEAFQAARRANELRPLKGNTSGWYLPAAGQCLKALMALGKVPAELFPNIGAKNLEMHKELQNYGIQMPGQFWTSTEASLSESWVWDGREFKKNGKHDSFMIYEVIPVAAF